jgi:hypothetical protein
MLVPKRRVRDMGRRKFAVHSTRALMPRRFAENSGPASDRENTVTWGAMRRRGSLTRGAIRPDAKFGSAFRKESAAADSAL